MKKQLEEVLKTVARMGGKEYAVKVWDHHVEKAREIKSVLADHDEKVVIIYAN